MHPKWDPHTRHPVDGQFGRELPAICNHCGVMTAWSKVARQIFLHFLEKLPLIVKIFKILFRKFSPPYRSTLLCSNVVKLFRRKIGEIVRYIPRTKQQNFGSLSNCRYCADRAQNLPGPACPATNYWPTLPDFIQSKSVHFRRSYSRMREGRSFAPYTVLISEICSKVTLRYQQCYRLIRHIWLPISISH